MAFFIYQARTINGNAVKGKIEARDEADAKIRLRAKQLIPTKLTLLNTQEAKGSELEEAIKRLLAPKIEVKELKIFTRQFSTLINSGIPIADALRILSEGSGSSRLLKDALLQIRSSIDVGKRLSESMAVHDRIFDRFYCNMIQAGEEAGILDTILLRLSQYIEKNEKIKGQVKGALVMPAVITVVAIIVITGIITFIIPKFQEFYQGSGKELPLPTQMLVDLSANLRENWFIYIVIVISVVASFVYYINTPEGKKQLDKTLITAPVIGDVVQKSSVARMTRTLSTLLSSGIGLIEAIDISAKTAGNYVVENALTECKNSVVVGKPFHVPLSRQKEIPAMVSQMVAIGEQSGSLDTMLGKIADFYEEEVETSVKAMTSLIEPIMMVVLGGAIAVILVAMYLPVFSMGDTIGV
ncbi:type II secretion system F family protein [Pseudobdellovibrio exovorus]|uniref:PilC, type II secretion system protein n=1 Tax=Pseudobdellovibrio exovorus JSS TaxID=1184267 RepID=M4V6Z1_9BACT|nr:type II secretion system F family protein [Pseudobdellovibrio exovorus]AGH95147.1 pilC, type II secretion system protein [Pseudobdellovibrio exovorus JSS]